jgi:hypothetical protein
MSEQVRAEDDAIENEKQRRLPSRRVCKGQQF